MSASFLLRARPHVNAEGELCLPVKNVPMARQWVLDWKEKREYLCECKEYHAKRSLDANAYLWTLCDKLAEAMPPETKESIYRRAIQEVGIYREFHHQTKKDAATLCEAWGRIGEGWVAQQVDFEPDGEHVWMRCYYGSSTYNTKQMARLIDNVVQDCKAVGIETATPQELARLVDEWGK